MRRLLLLQKLPLFASLSPGVLYGLAERCREDEVTAGQVIAAPRDHILFFPEGVHKAGGGSVLDSVDLYAPYLANLGGALVREDATARASGPMLEVDKAGFLAAVGEDFSLFLAVASALAEATIEAVRARHATLFGDEPANVESRFTGRLDLIERVLALREALPFGHDRVLSLVQLARQATEVHAADDLELWRQGDPAEKAIILVRGGIRASIDERDAFGLFPGSIVSLADVLTERRRWFTARADGAVLAFSIPVEHFIDVLEDQPELSHELLRALAAERTRIG